MTADPAVISCGACQRKFAWKPQLAGKRVKCKCGDTIAVPAATAPTVQKATTLKAAKPPVKPVAKPAPAADPDGLDGLFALADDAERAAAAMPIEVREAPEPVIPALKKTAKSGSPALLIPGYQRGSTAAEREKELRHVQALNDPVRDLYAPLAILALGFALHIAYFITRYHLKSDALAMVGMGVVVLTVIKAACLIGFALVVAGPLGVSFGGLWSAILKLAAIAVVTDGAIAWVDMGVEGLAGGHGGSGLFTWGFVGWPLALLLYWALMIYLFSMDHGDSWTVVRILAVCDRIMRTVLLLLLLETILSWGGVALPAAARAGSSLAHSKSVHQSELATHVDDLKEADQLTEAKAYIADGHQAILGQPVADWYAQGCPNVWFEMSGRDINGRRSGLGVIVELPDDKAKRARCYAILAQYYKDAGMGMFASPEELKDDGDTYMQVPIR